MAAQNALEVLREGRLTAPFRTPYEIVFRDSVHTLRHYAPVVAAPSAPLLLVPPLMVASEVYDMSPDVSAVAALVAAGIDVWMVDFGAPEREAGGMQRTLDDHVRVISESIDRVCDATGSDAHLAGYSQGGMFAYQVAAYRHTDRIASLITFGSPVDIHRNLPNVSDAVTRRMIGAARTALTIPLERIEGLPGFFTSTGFKLLRARKEIGHKLHDRQALEKRESRRRFLAGEGFVAWPGPALRKFVDEVIVHNRMATGGFVIDGRTVTLADITCPILCFIGLRDDMARPPSVRAIEKAAPNAEVFEVMIKAGHFGLVVGSTALATTWPTVSDWIKWRAGAGPRPELLPVEAASEVLDPEDLELAFEHMQFDVELFYDVVTDAARAVWNRVGDALRDVGESVDDVRAQVPRLRKLRGLRGNTRISLGLSLSQQARRIPDRTFFLWSGRAFSYSDSNRRVDAVVRGLISCGVRRDQRVGILMRPRPSFLTMVTAINRIGAVAVLLNAEAEKMSLERAFEIGEIEVLVADPDNAERGRAAFGQDVLVLGAARETRSLPAGVIDLEAIDPEQIELPAWYRPNPGRARDLSMVILTAGRTGQPRASRITNRRWAVSALGAAAACTLTTKDTVYSCLPMHHAAGALVSAGSALVGGARLALGAQFTPETFWTEVRRYGATVVFYAGEMCRDLVDAPHVAAETNHPIRLFAGSGMRKDVWNRLIERFGNVGVLEFYATTEGNAVLANASGEKVGALGRPMPGSADMALITYDFDRGDFARDDANHCVRCSTSEIGMLIARADDTHPGSDDASGRIRHNVFSDGDRWFFTGDLMKRDGEGDYWFVDRLSDMIMTAGGPVSSVEIEDALYDHRGVRLAAAYAVPGDRGDIAVATVVMAEGQTIDGAALFAALETRLEPHARPHYIRCAAELAMTDGRRPIKRPLQAAGIGPAPGVAVLRRDDAHRTYQVARSRSGEPREVTL